MGLESLFGLPAHPLLVHIPVVFVPLAAIGALALVLRPNLRRQYAWLVVALAAVGAVGAQLATGSGEPLEDDRQVRDLGDHPELGELARTISIVLFVLVVALWALDRWRMSPRVARLPHWLTTGVAVLTVLSAVGATTAVVAAGHTGARSVWQDDDQTVHPPGP